MALPVGLLTSARTCGCVDRFSPGVEPDASIDSALASSRTRRSIQPWCRAGRVDRFSLGVAPATAPRPPREARPPRRGGAAVGGRPASICRPARRQYGAAHCVQFLVAGAEHREQRLIVFRAMAPAQRQFMLRALNPQSSSFTPPIRSHPTTCPVSGSQYLENAKAQLPWVKHAAMNSER